MLKEKTYAWHHGVSPSSCQQRLELLTDALQSLADAGLGATSILANLHHRRIVPLIERELCIYEMSDAANPTVLARSQLLHERFLRERAISLRSVPNGNDDHWSFIMLPDAPAVSGLPLPFRSFAMHWCGLNGCYQQRVTVDATRSDPPTPRAQAAARAVQRRE
jgi:hypothetical protein